MPHVFLFRWRNATKTNFVRGQPYSMTDNNESPETKLLFWTIFNTLSVIHLDENGNDCVFKAIAHISCSKAQSTHRLRWFAIWYARHICWNYNSELLPLSHNYQQQIADNAIPITIETNRSMENCEHRSRESSDLNLIFVCEISGWVFIFCVYCSDIYRNIYEWVEALKWAEIARMQ